MSFILSSQSAPEILESAVGARARRRAELARAGLPIPSWFAITIAAQERFLRGHMLIDFLERAAADISSQPARARELTDEVEKRILASSVNPEISKAITAEWCRLGIDSARLEAATTPELAHSRFGDLDSPLALLFALRQLWTKVMSLDTVEARQKSEQRLWPVWTGAIVTRLGRPGSRGTARVCSQRNVTFDADGSHVAVPGADQAKMIAQLALRAAELTGSAGTLEWLWSESGPVCLDFLPNDGIRSVTS